MKHTVLAFCPIFYPHMGGAERTVFELYSRLIKRHGYTVHLVTINTENAPAYEVVGGIHVYRIGQNYASRAKKFLMLQFLFLKIYITRFRKEPIEMLHTHYAFPLCIAAGLIKLFTRLKYVVSEYHFATGSDITSAAENPWFVNRVAGLVYRQADLVLAISQDNRRYIKEVSGRDVAIVIKQGTDSDFFSPAYFDAAYRAILLSGADYLLVTTSRISPRKNLEDMIQATKLLIDSGLRVRLVINGTVDRGYLEYDTQLRKLVAGLGIESQVLFKGFVPEEELRVVYACADLFLLTSKYEGFGIANVEALSSGVPVITYDTGAARDYIIDGEAGYVVNNTPESLAARVATVLENTDLQQKMRQNARALVAKELNWDRYADINHEHLNSLFRNV